MNLKNLVSRGIAATVLTAMLLQTGMTWAGAAAPREELKIASLSDTHYLSPDLIADTKDFQTHLNSDRKMFAESEAFLNALLETVKKDDPDVLLISGDLTKDGEKESHEGLAAILENFQEETGTKIYITPGNHDLNNSNGMNFAPDGEDTAEDTPAVQAGRTSPQNYKEIYADLVYNDDSVIATFTPAEGKQAGGLSYVARPKDGFTIISIDSARYSADNTDSKTDEHETSGAVSADLEKWVVEQITAAKKRGDTVIGLQHHGLIPHFGMEPDILPMYLVNDYERLAQVYADAGMQYVFTGHMHANDIAEMTTEAGNTLYDIETGSVVTYPSPARCVTLTRTTENGTVKETMDIKTHLNVSAGTFVNPQTGKEQTVPDITAYGREHGFSNEMLTTTVNGFLNSYYAQILQAGGSKKALESLLGDLLGDSLPIKDITLEKLIDVGLPLLLPDASTGGEFYYDSEKGGIVVNKKVNVLITLHVVIPNAALKETLNILLKKLDDQVLAHPEVLDAELKTIIEALTGITVYGADTPEDESDDKTLLDYANYIYQGHLGGEDSAQNQPEWVKQTTEKIKNGELLEDVITTVIAQVSDVINRMLENLSLEELVGASAFDNNTKTFVPLEGRTPLIRAYDENAGNLLSAAFALLLKWPTDDETGLIAIPEGSNPEIGYSVADFLDGLSSVFTLDVDALLDELLNGTPADPEEGTEATEGLLTDELKGQLNGWLFNLVTTMGIDDIFPNDNNATITYEWKLLSDGSGDGNQNGDNQNTGENDQNGNNDTQTDGGDHTNQPDELPQTGAEDDTIPTVILFIASIGALTWLFIRRAKGK